MWENSSSGHVCHNPQHASSPVNVFIKTLAIDALSQDWLFPPFPLLSEVIRKLRTTQEFEVILIAHWCPSQMSECGPPTLLSVLQRPTVTTGICLERQVVPPARMEALMQHYQQQDFQKKSIDSQQLLEDPLQIKCTMTGGYPLLAGPQGKDLIRLVPQLLK